MMTISASEHVASELYCIVSIVSRRPVSCPVVMRKIFGVTMESRHDLVWSLRPIFNAMRPFGIDLNVTEPRLSLQRWAFRLLGVAVVVFTALSSFIEANGRPTTKFNPKSTMSWLNVAIEYAMASRSLLFPLIMSEMIPLLKWKQLGEKLQQVNKSMNYPASFYKRLRQVSLAAIAFVLILVFNLVSTSCYYHGRREEKMSKGNGTPAPGKI